jgi:predicted chitinase
MTQSSFGEALSRLCPFGITTPLLAAQLMAQISHECGAASDVVENPNYTAPAALEQLAASKSSNTTDR